MDTNNVEKLILSANYLVRANDKEASPELTTALHTILGSIIRAGVSIRFEESNRQYRLTTSGGLEEAAEWRRHELSTMEAALIPTINAVSNKARLAAFIHLTTMRLEGKITDADV